VTVAALSLRCASSLAPADGGARGAPARTLSFANEGCVIRAAGDVACFRNGAALAVPGSEGAEEIAVGAIHRCFVRRGRVLCWGSNEDGQLGSGTLAPSEAPAEVVGIEDAVHIYSGPRHTCALRANGRVLCWGDGERGELGDGASIDRRAPVEVVGVTDAVQISLGWSYSCALRARGAVYCWGRNDVRQLGDGTMVDRATPVAVVGVERARRFSAGSNSACALGDDGAVRCWGFDGVTRSSGPEGLRQPVTVTGLTDTLRLEAGYAVTCAISRAGALRCWGLNVYGQLNDGTRMNRVAPGVEPMGVADVVEVSVGYVSVCARSRDRSVRCWGYQFSGGLTEITGL
jgi:alpha-tubulin suppressor-like RCC1 family protein